MFSWEPTDGKGVESPLERSPWYYPQNSLPRPTRAIRAIPGWQRTMGRQFGTRQFSAADSDDSIRPPKLSWRRRFVRAGKFLRTSRGVTVLVVAALIVVMIGIISATIYISGGYFWSLSQYDNSL
ncbi:hypothetical protein NP493_910g01039 [Ridgeia piscesae]|uniref:Uncharacterized protein n=1 Tax=Ridgeia piscesae TaxID=27915 RepID=A0AAD9KKQ3_RIDPI|nr:hypothetical protein NP493_910g01039 [Ridgeia piscesae]